ncbi:MAG TPA: winged helix-turn-helix transcriptional regulator [Candidatus Bathyarchaeia archaeon]|nr:winged helix-turn-helix transcriptional regulator [Candidatus Bathyarchaeia archaeon]
MYRRYTLDEVKRKIINSLQDNATGLSGVELASTTGINRMTLTKYLNILVTMRLIKKKRLGSINVWFVEPGMVEYEFPLNYLEVQQKFMNAIMLGDGNQARNILVSVINSNIELLKILTDIVVPTVNTVNELYNRGRLGKTERIHLLNLILELIDLLKFSIQTGNIKRNASCFFVAASEDRIYHAKIGALALQILGFRTLYIGNVEQHIDPFFDIDFQRYVVKLWDNNKGLLIICIYSSEEGSLRFLYSASRAIKAKLKAEVRIVLFTKPELRNPMESLGADYVVNDLTSLIDWVERETSK